MDEVSVFDGLFDDDEVLRINQAAFAGRWRFGYSSVDRQDEPNFWYAEFEPRRLPGALEMFVDRMSREVRWGPALEVLRMNAVGHVGGSSGYPHYDHAHDDSISMLYFGNRRWDLRWGGATHFFDHKRGEIARAVTPKPGRVAVFPSSMPHSSTPPTQVFRGLRLTLSTILTPVASRLVTPRWAATDAPLLTPGTGLARRLGTDTYLVIEHRLVVAEISLVGSEDREYIGLLDALAAGRCVRLGELAAELGVSLAVLLHSVRELAEEGWVRPADQDAPMTS